MLSCLELCLLSSFLWLGLGSASAEAVSPSLVTQSASSKQLNHVLNDYLSNDELEQHLREFVTRTGCSDISRLFSIGTSTNGTELWALEISNHPATSEPKPNFKYVANLHGDEPLGRVLQLGLAEWLCSNWKTNEIAKRIVEDVKLYLLPSANPDGFARRIRTNLGGKDLNRDFPDPILNGANLEATGKEQPETLALMNWILSKHFVASASMHEGAFVANYPWDGAANGQTMANITEDDATFQYLARSYASLNPSMTASNNEFPSGITNGAQWYPLNGGMQDWNYIVGKCMELTLELNINKYAAASQLPTIWENNLAAMLNFPMTAIFGGLRGFTLGSRNTSNETYPLAANVTVNGSDWMVSSDPEFGNFYRPLAPGNYTVNVEAQDHKPQTATVIIPEDNTGFQLNITLQTVKGRELGSTINSLHHGDGKHTSLPRKFGGIDTAGSHGIAGDEELLNTQEIWINMMQITTKYLLCGFVLAVVGAVGILLLRRRMQASRSSPRHGFQG